MGDQPIPQDAGHQQDAGARKNEGAGAHSRETTVRDLESEDPRREEAVDFLDIVFIFSTAVFLVLFVFLLAGNQLPAGVQELLKESGKIGKYLIGAAGGTAFVSQVIRMVIRRKTNHFLLLYITLAFLIILGCTIGLARIPVKRALEYSSANLHFFPSYPQNSTILFAHTYHNAMQEKLIDQDQDGIYIGHLDLAYDTLGQSKAFINLLVRGLDDARKDPKSNPKEPPIYTICLQRAKADLQAIDDIFMKCGERECAFDSAQDKGLAVTCNGTTGKSSTSSLQPFNLFHPLPVLAASSQGEVASPSQPYWSVPLLQTLQDEKISQRGGYTRFDVSLTPSSALASSNSYQYQLFVNGEAVYFNGFPPEAFRSEFDPSKPITFAFGLRNLNFSGVKDGFEDLELQFTFFNGQVPTVRQTISRKYVALRSDAPSHPLDLSKGLVQDSAAGSIKWEATYEYSSHDDIFTAQALSVPELAKIAGVKKRLDTLNLSFEDQRVVLVLRPPLWCNSFAAGDIGLVQPSTGQVKFTFDQDQVNRLSVWARAASRKSNFLAVRELRATQPYNLAYRLLHPCAVKGKE